MRIVRIKNFLIYLLLFLLPWQTRLILKPGVLNGGYWEYGTLSVYASEILLWAAVVAYSAHFLYQRIRIKNHESPHQTLRDGTAQARISGRAPLSIKKHGSLLIFLYHLLILGVFVARPDVHFYYIFRFVEAGILCLLIRTVKRQKAAVAFVAGMIPQALLGIYQFLTQSSFANKWLGMALHDPAVLGTYVIGTSNGRWLRAYGGLPHPNILGGYLVVAVILLMNSVTYFYSPSAVEGLKMNEKKGFSTRSKNIILCSIFVILASALFFTFSRSAWLAFFVSAIFMFFKVKNKKLIRCTIVYAMLVFLILGTVFHEPAFSRYSRTDRLEQKSTSERITGYADALALISKHPLFGVGLGNYTYAAWKEGAGNLPSFAYQPVHNIFLLILAEIGAIGFFLAYVLGRAWKFVMPSWLPIVVMISLGLFDHYLVTLYSGIMLFSASFSLIKQVDS